MAVLVSGAATALALVALPREVGFSATQGQWRAVSGGLRVSATGPLLRGGEHASLRLGPVRDATADVFLILSRRRPDKPVLVQVSSGDRRLAELSPVDEPERVERAVEPRLGRVDVRVEAHSLRPRVPPAFLLHRFGLVRPWSRERFLAWLAPAAVGIGVLLLLWPRCHALVATLGSLHGAVAVVGLLALLWDPLAGFRLAPQTWRRLILGGLASLSVLILVPRLFWGGTRAPPHGRISNGLLLRVASVLLGLGCSGVALILAQPRLLRLAFPDLDVADAGVVARSRAGRDAMMFAGWITLVGGLVLGTSPLVERLPRRLLAVGLVGAQLLFYLGALEALVAPRHAPLYFSPDPVLQARQRRGLYLKHPHYGHVLNPDASGYQIGGDGFRGPPFPYVKPPGELRLVMIGDSIAFGLGVTDDSTCEAHLERLLSARVEQRVRVINAGVPAHDSLLALRRLEGMVLNLDPDVVIAIVGWNDLAFSLNPSWTPRTPLELWSRPPPRLALMSLLRSMFPPPPARSTPHPDALAAYGRNLRQMLRLGQRHGFRMVFTNLPTILSSAGNTPDELRKARFKLDARPEQLLPFRAILERICANEPDAICVLDVFPLTERDKGRFFFDHCHPVREGYAVMAQRIARVLLDPDRALLPLGRAPAVSRTE